MGKILFAERDGVHVLKFVGDVRVTLGPTLNNFLAKLTQCKNFKSVIIDLSETQGIDSTSLGLLAKISIKTQEAFASKATIVSPNEDITRILMSMGFDEVFIILKELMTECGLVDELATEIVSESALRDQVIEAHKVLMSLNEHNADEFRNLVDALEDESTNEVSIPRNRVA
ncbi:MAG: STAS domain-containing protein [Pseudomonadales bacterium]